MYKSHMFVPCPGCKRLFCAGAGLKIHSRGCKIDIERKIAEKIAADRLIRPITVQNITIKNIQNVQITNNFNMIILNERKYWNNLLEQFYAIVKQSSRSDPQLLLKYLSETFPTVVNALSKEEYSIPADFPKELETAFFDDHEIVTKQLIDALLKDPVGIQICDALKVPFGIQICDALK